MKNATLLVIDDSDAQLFVSESLLENLDYEVLLANNGPKGLEIAQEKQPDLILLDILMPKMNGFEVCAILKSNDLTKNIPVLFLTSSNETEDIVRAFDAGGVDYIIKPFKNSEVAARIKTHLDLKKSQNELIANHKLIEQQLHTIHKQEKSLLEKQNHDIKLELDRKTRELTASMLQLAHVSDIMNKMIDEISSNTATFKEEPARRIESIITSFRTQLEVNNWEEFEKRFISLNKNFYNQLQTEFPSLSNNELKLCAFLSLNMSTKDICSLTLQTEDSVKKARYRLRKKLGLEESDNMVSFLSKY